MGAKLSVSKDITRILRPFLRRAWVLLLPDNILCALSACGLFLILRSVLVRLSFKPFSLLWLIPAGTAAGLLHSFFCLPDWKDTARMMDAAGFQDRAVTMLDYATQDTPMVQLQRTEALVAADQIDPNRIHRHPSVPLVCLCSVLVLAGLLLNITEPTPTLEEEPIRGDTELRAAMRQDIMLSDLPEEIKQQLLADLNSLSPEDENERAQIELLADIDALTLDIHEQQAAELLSAENFGALMMKLPEWQALGQAFLLQNALDAHAAMRAHEAAAVVHRTLNVEYAHKLIDSLDQLVVSAGELELEPPEKAMEAILSRLGDGLRGALDAEDAPMAAALGSYVLESADAQIQELLNPGGATRGDEENRHHNEDEEEHGLVVTGLLNAGGGTGITGQPLSGAQEATQGSELCYEPSIDKTITRNYIPGRLNTDGTRQRVIPDNEAPLVPYGEVLGKYFAEILEKDLPEDLLNLLKSYYYSL